MVKRRSAEAENIGTIPWIGPSAFAAAVATVPLFPAGGASLHLVVATLLGVTSSILLGCGPYALYLISDRTGQARSIASAARKSPGDGTARG